MLSLDGFVIWKGSLRPLIYNLGTISPHMVRDWAYLSYRGGNLQSFRRGLLRPWGMISLGTYLTNLTRGAR